MKSGCCDKGYWVLIKGLGLGCCDKGYRVLIKGLGWGCCDKSCHTNHDNPYRDTGGATPAVAIAVAATSCGSRGGGGGPQALKP